MPAHPHDVILIHGTWASKAHWISAESALALELKARLGPDTIIHPFRWSGNNTFAARFKASERLTETVRTLAAQGRKVTVVAHSHGGSVVIYALSRHSDLIDCVAGVVFLATPFFSLAVRPGYEALLLGGLWSVLIFAMALIAHLAGYYFHFVVPSEFEGLPSLVALSAVLFALFAALGLIGYRNRQTLWQRIEPALGFAARADTSHAPPVPCLFVRMTGDEVTLLLVALQFFATISSRLSEFAAWLMSTIVNLVSRLQGRLSGKITIAAIFIAAVMPFVLFGALHAEFTSDSGPDFADNIQLWNPFSTG